MYFCVYDKNERCVVVSQKTQKAQTVDPNTKLVLENSLENFSWAETRISQCFQFRFSFNLQWLPLQPCSHLQVFPALNTGGHSGAGLTFQWHAVSFSAGLAKSHKKSSACKYLLLGVLQAGLDILQGRKQTPPWGCAACATPCAALGARCPCFSLDKWFPERWRSASPQKSFQGLRLHSMRNTSGACPYSYASMSER